MKNYIDNIKKNIESGKFLGRVSAQHKNLYSVIVDGREIFAEVSGKFIFNANKKEDFASVGDYVLLDRNDDKNGNAIIEKVFERKTALKRKNQNNGQNEILSTNIDYIFICMSLNNDFNLRRLERYIAVSYESGATPIIVLTKADLCDNIVDKLMKAQDIAIGLDILIISNKDKNYIDEIVNYLKDGITACFVGSSGVGKSSIVNALLGENRFKVNGLRDDDKGRHTTTRREMTILDNGSIVIDTPGIRELAFNSSENVDKTFSDIIELEAMCKFSDCSHTTEPNCAIKEALENGTLSQKRYESYLKLKEETTYLNLNFKEIENEKIKKMFGSKKEYKKKINEVKKKNKY